MSSGRSRRARSPAWTAGCRVLTRPSIISGCFVTSLTSRTGSPASRSVRAVPPVDSRFKPSSCSAAANWTTPVLSETLISAFGISLLLLYAERRAHALQCGHVARGGDELAFGLCQRLLPLQLWHASLEGNRRQLVLDPQHACCQCLG